MKIALCIHGQPRKALETYPFIYENIIKPNNADVFIHMNFDKNNLYMEKSHCDNGNCYLQPNIDEQLISLYNPIRYLIEPPKNFSNKIINLSDHRLKSHKRMNAHKNWTDDDHKSYIIKQMYSFYYSVYKCNELKELYSLEQNIHYDYIICIRFDLCPKQPIICSNYNPNFIYYLEIGQPDNLISDWFNFGSNAIMNIYSSIFLNVEYLNTFLFLKKQAREENNLEQSDITGGIYEHMLRDLMYFHNIPKQGLQLNFSL